RCAALKGKPSDRARVWLSSATVSRTAALAASATSGPSETDIIPDHPFYLAFYTDVPAARSRMCPMTTAGRLTLQPSTRSQRPRNDHTMPINALDHARARKTRPFGCQAPVSSAGVALHGFPVGE